MTVRHRQTNGVRRGANPIAGVIVGGVMALLASLTALSVYALRGNAPFEYHGITLGRVLLAYVAGGLLGGALGGVLLPLATWRTGAVLLGILTALPLFYGLGVLSENVNLFAIIMSSTLVGGVVGYGLWTPPRGEP